MSIFEWYEVPLFCRVRSHFLAGFNCSTFKISLHEQEIVTAHKNRVRTVPLICDGYEPLKLTTKDEDGECFLVSLSFSSISLWGESTKSSMWETPNHTLQYTVPNDLL